MRPPTDTDPPIVARIKEELDKLKPCRVCGRNLHKSKNSFPTHASGWIYHTDTCFACYVWYAKESSKITKSRFQEVPNGYEYVPCMQQQYRRKKHQKEPFCCVLPRGHTGAHIAFNVFGEVYDAWNLESGFLGLPIHKDEESDVGGFL